MQTWIYIEESKKLNKSCVYAEHVISENSLHFFSQPVFLFDIKSHKF